MQDTTDVNRNMPLEEKSYFLPAVVAFCGFAATTFAFLYIFDPLIHPPWSESNACSMQTTMHDCEFCNKIVFIKTV